MIEVYIVLILFFSDGASSSGSFYATAQLCVRCLRLPPRQVRGAAISRHNLYGDFSESFPNSLADNLCLCTCLLGGESRNYDWTGAARNSCKFFRITLPLNHVAYGLVVKLTSFLN